MLDALQFETEIKGTALNTLEDIEKKLKAIAQKTVINIEVQGIQEFRNFVTSADFKDVAKNISSAFGGQKAKNVTDFFTNLRTEIEKVKASLQSGDYSAFMTQISQLTKQFAALNTEYQKFLKGTGTKAGDDVIASMSRRLKEVERAIAQLQPAYKKLQQEQEKLEKQQEKLAAKQERLANKMKSTTRESDRQSSSLNGLSSMMNRYLSIYAVGRFASEMAQITGELELQKRSLEVIVGNANAANELYGTIRDMSQMSPFTFQDLMKSTRQLSAFGIETKDLYDTMKALSDIGAGLSVDVQRLILAYGHTRSYGYLSGIQNRQFETAGIDMIGGLVKRYNELADAEEKAGRAAERVTRQDIFKKMSKREISFEDVNAVIMDLDREGGKFFNMQERQFDTLGGKLRNLRNNWNIMMSEMGQQHKGILKGGVNILNELTGNWEKYAGVIKALIIPLGALKIAMMLVNAQIKEGVVLLNRAGLQTMGNNLKTIFKNLGTVLKSATTWITAAITAIMALIQHMNKVNKKSASLAETMREGGKNDELAIRSVMDTYGGEHVRRIQEKMGFKDGVQILKFRLEFDKDQLTSMNLTGAIEDVKEKLQALSPMYAGDLVDIASIKTQYEQFKVYMQKLEDLRYASDLTEAYSAAFELANKSSAAQTSFGRMFNDDFLTDVQDYQQSLRKSTDILQEANEETLDRIDKAMDGALTRIKQSMDYVDLKDALRDYMLNVIDAYNAAADEVGAKNLGQIAGNRRAGGLSGPLYGDKNGWASKNPELAGMLPDASGSGDFLAMLNSFLDPGLFARYLDEQRAEMYKGAKPFADTIMDVIRTNYADNTEAAINYVAAQLKIIKTESGATDPKVIEDLYDAILSYMGEQGKKYKEAFDREKVVERFNAAIANKIDARTTEEEAAKIRDEAAEGLKDWAENVGIDLEKIGGENGELFVKAMAAAMSEVKLLTNWQERLVGPNGIIQINTGLANDLKKTFDVVEGAEIMQKEFDDLMKTFDNSEGITKGALKAFFGTDFEVSELTDDIRKDDKQLQAALEERRDILQDFVDDFKARIRELKMSEDIDEQKEGELMENRLKNEVENTLKLYKEILEIIMGMSSISAQLTTKKNNKTQKAYHDEEAKRWDERIRIMKEAYDWYDKWEQKVGESEAFDKVDERYRDIFDEWRTDKVLPFDFQAKDVKDYFKYVEQIRDDALAKYRKQKNDDSKNNGQEALRVYRQAVAVLEEGSYDNFVKAAEKFQSIIEKTMDDLQRRWSLFTDIRDKTGNAILAATLSGIDDSFTTQADAMREAVQKAFEDAGGSGDVTFDVSLDKEAVRAMFENAIPGDRNDAKYMESIDGLIKGFEEWQKSEEEQEKMDINVTVDLMSSAVDLQSEVSRIGTAYRTRSAALTRIFPEGGADYRRVKAILDANTQMSLVQAQEAYKLLMDGVTTMSVKAAQRIRKDYINVLTAQLKAGSITAKEYADGIKSVNERMMELQNAPGYGRSFMEGGFGGVGENMANRGAGLMQQGGMMMQQGAAMGNQAMQMMGQNAVLMGSKMQTAGKGMSNTVAVIDMIINGINDAVQGFKQTYDRIREMNVALGRRDSDKWTNADTFLSSFSGASAAAASGWNSLKSGDIAGAIDGTVGSWTEWFKGFAEGSDKKREYQIKLSERQLKSLENMNTRLESISEAAFGYGGQADADTLARFTAKLDEYNRARKGETWSSSRENQKQLWAILGGTLLPVAGAFIADAIYEKQQTNKYSSVYGADTAAAMDKALQTGSVYDAQYASMMMERDELRAELSELEAMNSRDNDRIEETKQKLWEVENELSTFASDLTKQLWGIDIKGWADQISDALMNAFENGEDAAKAFEDVTRNIMQQVAGNILKLGVIQPMMEGLQKKLFGTKDESGQWQGGVISAAEIASNPQEAAKKGILAAQEYMDDYGTAMLIAGKELYTGLNTALGGVLTNPSTKTLSASIQGTTEETSDLLAGYVNALRQDVAADRIMMEQWISEVWPAYMAEITSGMQTMNRIDQNVSSILALLSENGALYSLFSSMSVHLDRVTSGVERVYVN